MKKSKKQTENVIVKYGNDLNRTLFSGFTAVDFNLFMALCSKADDKGTNEIVITYSELKKLAGFGANHTLGELNEKLDSMYRKISSIDFTIYQDKKKIYFHFFYHFEQDEEKKTLTVKVDPIGAELLNELAGNFTAFELQEYVKLKSKYSKTIFRFLKQFKDTGRWEPGVDLFRELLDIPKDYDNKRITVKIIKPAMEELKPIFQNLKCEIKRGNKQGRPISGYIFTFTPQRNNNEVLEAPEKKAPAKPSGTKTSYQKKKSNFMDFQEHDYSPEDWEELEAAALEGRTPRLSK